MADWATVVLAGIAGLAGVAGSVVQGAFSQRGISKAAARDDLVNQRSSLEQLSVEIEDLGAQNGQRMMGVMRILNGTAKGQPIPTPSNLGRLRAMAALYFPECAQAFADFDATVAKISGIAHDPKDDPVMAIASLTMLHLRAIDTLVLSLRACIGPIGSRFAIRS